MGKLYEGEALQLAALENGFVELCFDLKGESVNKFNIQAVDELAEVLDLLEADAGLKGVLVASAKAAFVVGADITEFGAVFAAGPDRVVEHLAKNNRNFCRLEDLNCPVVVAIDGYALGGGMEFCLACDYRIGTSGAQLGQPEVKLGIIPGWGGTVRLPRLAGLDVAIEWIASGKNYRAEQALDAGVLDGVVDAAELKSAALSTLEHLVSGRLDYRARRQQKKSALKHNDIEAMLAFESAKAFVAAEAGRNYPAPVAAVGAMQKAAKLERDQALTVEAKVFAEMASTPVAQALVSLFVRDQMLAKKAKALARQGDGPIARAGVLGAGIMGGGIAYQAAYKGVPVAMKDVNQAGIDLGLSEANKLLAKLVDRGRLSATKAGEVLNRIEPTLDYSAFARAELVVEAVVESPEVKEKVLAEAEAQLSDGAILTSNTSTISISRLAKVLKRPERFCGMHFFNPVHRMPLVEVIRGEKTSDETIAKTVAFATQLGKKVVVVNDCPGFLINRILFPYFAGFAMLLRDGADFRQVDKVMQRWGWPMGPAYLLDVVGVDTAEHAERVIAEGYPERMKRDFTSCIDVLFNAKRLGQKTGSGFYRYEIDTKGKPKQLDDDSVDALLAPHMASRREFDDEEIIARCMIPMATELIRCLEEGIVASPWEADMALIYGLGFPPFRGGVFHWLDQLGLAEFVAMAKPFESLGELYKPTEALQAMAAAGERYYPLAGASAGGEK